MAAELRHVAAHGITIYSYNDQGYLQSVTDPLGRLETTAYDSVGRVTTQTLPNGEQILYDYDENGNLSSITPPAVPDSAGGISYLYDKDQKLLETVFSDSTSIQMIYDTTFAGSSRPIAINYAEGSTSFAYDSTTGNLTSITSSDSVVTSYNYDGSLTTQVATSGPVDGNINFTYNGDFRVTSQSINGANTVGFSYDDDGLLVGAGALSMSYNSQNGLLNNTAMHSITSSYSYNSFGELLDKNTAYNVVDLYDRSFTRDSLGRITSIDEIVEGDSTLYEYAYNDIGYLVEEKVNGAVTAEYRYDANGNRTAFITPTDTIRATYDEQDRMLTYGNASYSYGPRGDLQQKIAGTDTTTYNYDTVGNLRSVVLPDGKVIEYIIDAIKLKIPICSAFYKQTIITRFCQTLGTLLHSGITLADSLAITLKTSQNLKVRDTIQDILYAVKKGKSFGGALNKSNIFPPVVLQMIAVGEETAELDDMLLHIAAHFRKELDLKVDTLISIIEPALILVLGLTLGFLIVSMYLPMFELMNVIG